jgi:hypothetical protein
MIKIIPSLLGFLVIGLVIATLIDHVIFGISCVTIKIHGLKLFLHKLMYIALGAGTMLWFFPPHFH